VDTDARAALRRLLDRQTVAALATLHGDEPGVSMVPFALFTAADGGTRIVIHVSELATHTRDMQRHARVALLVTGEAEPEVTPLARPRVALQCDAAELPRLAKDYIAAKKAYVGRFPDARPIFDLGDFSLFVLKPVSARLVAGFGKAFGLVAEPLDAWLAG
jgi:putative heme iron utilization protein